MAGAVFGPLEAAASTRQSKSSQSKLTGCVIAKEQAVDGGGTALKRNQLASTSEMDSASVKEQLRPELERKDAGGDLSVHMTFGYRSGLKQFSDRVIRLYVQRDSPQEAGGASEQPDQTAGNCWCDQPHGSDCVAPLEKDESKHQDYAVDLEMQAVVQSEREDEDTESKPNRIPAMMRSQLIT